MYVPAIVPPLLFSLYQPRSESSKIGLIFNELWMSSNTVWPLWISNPLISDWHGHLDLDLIWRVNFFLKKVVFNGNNPIPLIFCSE